MKEKIETEFEPHDIGSENEARRYLSALEEEDFDCLLLRLSKYSVSEAKKLRWWTGNVTDLAKAETPESIVSLVFERVLTGKRKWNPSSQPDFQKFMMDAIDSVLYHLAKGKENRILSRSPEEHGTKKYDDYHSGTFSERRPSSPEENLLSREKENLQKKALIELENLIRDDLELMSIFEAIKQGSDNDIDISNFTGLRIEKVRVAKKRLSRRLDTLSKRFAII